MYYYDIISDQFRSVSLLQIRLEFLVKCRDANIKPRTLTRKTLLETIKNVRKEIATTNELFTRNLIEESALPRPEEAEALLTRLETQHNNEISIRTSILNRKFHNLIQEKDTELIFNKAAYIYPVFNFSKHIISPNLVEFMHKFRPETAIFGFATNELNVMAEIDCVAAEVQELYSANETMILEEQKKFRQIRKHTYSFITLAESTFKQSTHNFVRIMAKQLTDFLSAHSLLAVSPDKGKGWVIIYKENIVRRLQETINTNYTEFIRW